MKRTKLLTCLMIFCTMLNWAPALGQKKEKAPTLEESSVEDKFKYIKDKSHTYEDYRVIKAYLFNRLRSQVTDTMELVRVTIADQQKDIKDRQAIIDSLHIEVKELEEELKEAVKTKNSLSFIGINMSKTGYNTLVWLIISGLSVFVFVFLLVYRRSQKVTQIALKDLEETKEEYENHRKRALRREEEVVHRYHSELNKCKEKLMKATAAKSR